MQESGDGALLVEAVPGGEGERVDAAKMMIRPFRHQRLDGVDGGGVDVGDVTQEREKVDVCGHGRTSRGLDRGSGTRRPASDGGSGLSRNLYPSRGLDTSRNAQVASRLLTFPVNGAPAEGGQPEGKRKKSGTVWSAGPPAPAGAGISSMSSRSMRPNRASAWRRQTSSLSVLQR